MTRLASGLVCVRMWAKERAPGPRRLRASAQERDEGAIEYRYERKVQRWMRCDKVSCPLELATNDSCSECGL
jgi:hypothetical protein